MPDHSWERSVEIAKTALLKTFEGRMTVAEESLLQCPDRAGRRAAGERTLADFAEEVGVEHATLKRWRRVHKWLGNRRGTAPIGSYALAEEAMISRRWETGRAFAEFVLRTDPPLWEQEGYEPHQFRSWTVDALRVHLGQRPTNTTLVALRAAQEDREPTADEEHAAAAQDAIEEARTEAGQVEDYHQSREVLDAMTDAREEVEEHHYENVGQVLQGDGVPDDYEMERLVEALERDHLPSVIAERAMNLRRALERVPEWLERYGHITRPGQDEAQGVLMHDTLDEEKGKVEMAFAEATGNLAQQFSQYLATARR